MRARKKKRNAADSAQLMAAKCRQRSRLKPLPPPSVVDGATLLRRCGRSWVLLNVAKCCSVLHHIPKNCVSLPLRSSNGRGYHMEQKIVKESKLNLLTALRDVLLDLSTESSNSSQERDQFNEMLVKTCGMLSDERRRLGYYAVYPIVDGCAQESLFEGTLEHCRTYVEITKTNDPQFDLIVLQL